jgi:hypothetical protein
MQACRRCPTVAGLQTSGHRHAGALQYGCGDVRQGLFSLLWLNSSQTSCILHRRLGARHLDSASAVRRAPNIALGPGLHHDTMLFTDLWWSVYSSFRAPIMPGPILSRTTTWRRPSGCPCRPLTKVQRQARQRYISPYPLKTFDCIIRAPYDMTLA